MDRDLVNFEEQKDSQPSTKINEDVKRNDYHKPKLLCYGGLAELARNNPSRAMDGGPVDCSLT